MEHALLGEMLEKAKHGSRHAWSYLRYTFQYINPAFEKRYLAFLARRHRWLYVVGAERLGLRLPLERIFLNPRLAVKSFHGTKLLLWREAFSREKRNQVILGNPGTGKSTLLDYLALVFSSRIDPLLCERLGNPLPLYARLSEVGAVGDSRPLVKLLDDSIRMPTLPPNFSEERLNAGNCIVLLDGLDEILEEAMRQKVLEEIQDLADSHEDCWFVVTCRAASWRGQLKSFQAYEIQPLDRDDVQRFIRTWHDELERSIGSEEVSVAAKERRLWDSLVSREDLLSTASSPLMLSVITLVNFLRGDVLPKGNAALYAECVQNLIEWRGQDSPQAHEEKLVLLKAIAYYSVKKNLIDLPISTLAQEVVSLLPTDLNLQSVRQAVSQLIKRPDILVTTEHDRSHCRFIHRSLRDHLAASYIVENEHYYNQLQRRLYDENWREVVLNAVGLVDPQKANDLVKGLLKKEDGSEAEFAALALAEREKRDLPETVWDTVLDRLKSRLEVVDSIADFTRLANALMAADIDAGRYWLADSFQQGGNRRKWILALLPTLGRPRGGHFRNILLELVEEKEEDQGVRAQAVLALATIGNNDETDILDVLTRIREERSSPDLQAAATWALCELGGYGDLGLVKVEAGEFKMGDDLRVLSLPSYYIGKYPVTVQKFKEFIAQKEKYRPQNEDCFGGHDSHPVTWVTWYEALEYARWNGLVLPSEAEWEKAARGTDGRKFPWGNRWERRRANTLEHLRKRTRGLFFFHRNLDRWARTTPVGELQAGKSPYHCHDMAGNVWEWTRSLWGEKLKVCEFDEPYVPTDGREDLNAPKTFYRVVRGGSFRSPHQFCRCAHRHRHSPEKSLLDIGFRVVSSPPRL